MSLFEQPRYLTQHGLPQKLFVDSTRQLPEPVRLDEAAILSILNFGYVSGDDTLARQVTRQPWLAAVNGEGSVTPEPIPAHGYVVEDRRAIAKRLFQLLVEEAERACVGHKEIYLLLSGGLDSRIAALVLHELHVKRSIPRPVCTTWGMENSRDVVYGSAIAQELGFDWLHLNLQPQHLLENMTENFGLIGGLVSPVHLHRMSWFKNVSSESVVFAASYGDSVGRAEYSGSHLIELNRLRPYNYLGIVDNRKARSGVRDIQRNIEELHSRSAQKEGHVLRELEMQGIYMRNMIGHAMSLISNYCTVYQMFTHPQVYSYVWSLHPLLRDDQIYRIILTEVAPSILHVPWARSNKTLQGEEGERHLTREYHRYAGWLAADLRRDVDDLCDERWFSQLELFNIDSIRKLKAWVYGRNGKLGFRPFQDIAWLAAFRHFCPSFGCGGSQRAADSGISARRPRGFTLFEVYSPEHVRRFFSKHRFVRKLRRGLRLIALRLRRQ